MISNVALSKAEGPKSAQAPAESGDAGDTGVFDAMLTAGAQAADATARNAQLAGTVDGAELFADGCDDSADDVTDDTEAAVDALSFLAALLPMPTPKAPPTHEAAAAGTAPISIDTKVDAQANTASDLADALALGTAGMDHPESPSTDAKASSATPVIDATSLNSLTGPAELFAHASRHSTVERVDSAPLTTHVRDPRWADELGNRLASMVRTGESSASLQLTPVDLGPLEVNVTVRDSQATVHFGAANAETRALLEATMPRLREMLAAQGFQLMDSSVSHGFARPSRHEAAGTRRVDADSDVQAVAAQPIHIRGLLDLYA